MTSALRVLHVISGDLWAGAETQAFTLMSHLARMPDTEVAAVVMNEGVLADRLRATGIRVHITNERELRPWRIWVRLRGVLLSWRPDVIHTHREKENILTTLANRTCRRVPLVRTIHGGAEHAGATGWRGARHRMTTGFDRWCTRVSRQRVIAVSRALGIEVGRDFPSENVVIIENGVDAEAVRAQLGSAEFRIRDPDATHVGIAGRLAPVKRVDLFLETAGLLRRACPERRWRFHVFGDGPARADLQKLAEREGVADAVTFHGHRRDIASGIGGLDALVICSDHEGMPMIALEAAALAVPTVAHAVGGLIDVVPREFLVTRHDAKGYSEAVLRAVQKDARAIIEPCAANAMMRYSAKRNAERVRVLYGEVAAWRNAGSSGG